MNIESMGKLLMFILTCILFVFPFTSFAEEPGVGGSGGTFEEFIIFVSPNPVPKNTPFQIAINGQGYERINIIISDRGKSVGNATYTISEKKIEANGETNAINSFTASPPTSSKGSWRLVLHANKDKFAPSKIYSIQVEGIDSGIVTQAIFKTGIDPSVNAKAPPICDLENNVCRSVNTSLGKVDPDPLEVISTVLRYLIGISGGLFLLIFIRAGYRMITSQGNPEAIKETRESITSAIVGFLFLLFSFVILEVIGVDLFQLPGFNS